MIKKNWFKGLITVLCAAGFTALAYFVTQGAVLSFDLTVQEAVFDLRTDWMTALLTPLTYSGNWQPVTAVCVAFLLIPRTRRSYGYPLTAAALTSLGFYETLKFVFQRSRPDIALRLIEEQGFSFPSGHSLTSLVVWGMAILLIRSYARLPSPPYEEEWDFPRIVNPAAVNAITAILSIYIFLMGFSRVYLGVHYPTDVLGSWCLGGCILAAFHSSLIPFLSSAGKSGRKPPF